MNSAAPETRTVVVEREFAHPPEKLWRALTQPHLIAEWLMANDFIPELEHRFKLKADWGIVDCQVLAIEPNRTLAYSWAALGLDSVVTWTLTPTRHGTHLRMEQTGFAALRLAEILRRPGADSGAARLSRTDQKQRHHREEQMNWSNTIRQVHRWVSIAFTVAVIINIAAMTQTQPAFWVGLLALVPLIALLATGLYLFARPYLSASSAKTQP